MFESTKLIETSNEWDWINLLPKWKQKDTVEKNSFEI